MLDFTNSTPAIAPVLANVQAAYNLRDLAQLERDATFALKAAQLIRDDGAVAIAKLFLGLARRDTWYIDSAARAFELRHDYYNTAVTLCIRSEFEPDRARRLALLDRALGHLERAKRGFAQLGDFARWDSAEDVERAIGAAMEQAVAGVAWVEGKDAEWHAREDRGRHG